MKINSSSFFSEGEYLLGDSAFSSESNLVPAFKAFPNIPLSQNKSNFNLKLAQARICAEHTIGLLKNRFPILKCMNVKIKKKKI